MNKLLVVGVAAVALNCRSAAPDRSVTAGRAVTVTRVSVAAATLNYEGKEVQAGPGHQYVLLDCRIAASANEVDFDDFQLVRDSAAELGHETNVGDNDDSDYFYWTYVDASGRPMMEPPATTGPFTVTLAFKVPADARRGYLFHSGLYWGPFDFQ